MLLFDIKIPDQARDKAGYNVTKFIRLYTVSKKKRGHGFFCITLTNVDTVS